MEWAHNASFRVQELKQANASLQLGLMDLQRELDDERAAFRAHFERFSR